MSLGAQDYERCVLPKYLGVFSVRTQRVTDGTKSEAGVLISEVPKRHTVLRNDSPREPQFYCWSVSLSQTVINQVNCDFHRRRPSTPASQPRTRPGLCLQGGGCEKPKSPGRSAGPRHGGPGRDGGRRAATVPELGAGRPSREPSSARGSRAGRPRPLKAGRPAVPTKAAAPPPPSPGPPGRPRPHPAPPRSLLVRADPVSVTDSEILGRHLGRQQHSRPQRRPDRSRGASRRAVRAPPDPPSAVGEGGRRRPPGREPGAAVRRRRPRARCSARGSAPMRPHRVPGQARRGQPGPVAIIAPRGPSQRRRRSRETRRPKDPRETHFRLRGGARVAEAEVTRGARKHGLWRCLGFTGASEKHAILELAPQAQSCVYWPGLSRSS
ncbi:dapper homolog 3-like [Peromyscus eremicus]|uniref:dapper homolog 3-like n=1 Tax=Peromyscus eremicus TaxID=42410 RepID=UPI0027DB9F56|nr:dapper homolog 3-like [Peromyscus eremicus]